MYACPNCRKPTIPLRAVVLSTNLTFPHCAAVLRQQSRWSNILPVAMLVPAGVFSHFNKTGLFTELLVLGMCAVAGFAIASRRVRLEVVP